MKIKLLILWACILILPSVLQAATPSAETNKSILVWQKDGKAVSFNLDEHPKIYFKDTDLVISTDRVTVSYDQKEVSRFTFSAGDNTGIGSIVEPDITFTQTGDLILVTGIAQDKPIRVYSSSGQLLQSRKTDSSSHVVVSLAKYPSGIYLIQADTITFKFTKR